MRQSIIGKACKRLQCRIDKNNYLFIFEATKSIDSSLTYLLKYQKQIRNNPLLGRRERVSKCRFDKNNSVSIFVATNSIDLSSTYTLKYQKQIRGNQLLGRRVRVISVDFTRSSHSPYSLLSNTATPVQLTS